MQTTYTNRELLRQFKPVARPRSHSSGQAKSSTATVRRIDFLSIRFVPKLAKHCKQLADQKTIEQGFFKSLSILTDYYQIEVADASHYPYPINLYELTENAGAQVRELNLNLHLKAQTDKDGLISFSTEQHIWNGNKLYYLPVKPLYELFLKKDEKKSMDLLLSVFAYLYQTVQIPYFSEPSSYLYYKYDMIADWLMDDYESEGKPEDVEADFNQMWSAGDAVLAEIKQEYHLDLFENRLKNYHPENPNEQSIHNSAKLAFLLKSKYPKRSIYDNLAEHEIGDDEYGVITPENYLSFFWTADGHIYDQLWDTINTDLQEYSCKDEPIVKKFDKCPRSKKNYNFEASVCDLLDELCDTLNDL